MFALLIYCADPTTLIRRAFVGFLFDTEKASRIMLSQQPIGVWYTTYCRVLRAQACYAKNPRQLIARYAATAGSAAAETSLVGPSEEEQKIRQLCAHSPSLLIRSAACIRQDRLTGVCRPMMAEKSCFRTWQLDLSSKVVQFGVPIPCDPTHRNLVIVGYGE